MFGAVIVILVAPAYGKIVDAFNVPDSDRSVVSKLIELATTLSATTVEALTAPLTDILVKLVVLMILRFA